MKMRIVRNRFLLLFVLGGVLVSTGIATAGYAVRYLEETYDDTDCDPGDDTNDDREFSMMTYRWYAYMGYQNYSTATVIDDYFREPALTDPDCEDWGRDYSYIELADIAFVGGHGNTARRVSNGPVFYRLRQNEIYDDDCKMWPDQQMRLGEGASDDIEILHMYSCHSMTIDNNAHINTWHPVFGGLHQVDGLHGNGHVGLSLADDFYWLARSGFSTGVGLEWIITLYVDDWDNNGYDNCPVAYSGRGSSADALYLLNNEQYDTREDYTDIADPTNYKRIWISGCLPNGASELP